MLSEATKDMSPVNRGGMVLYFIYASKGQPKEKVVGNEEFDGRLKINQHQGHLGGSVI